jgi:hypothetical protein
MATTVNRGRVKYLFATAGKNYSQQIVTGDLCLLDVAAGPPSPNTPFSSLVPLTIAGFTPAPPVVENGGVDGQGRDVVLLKPAAPISGPVAGSGPTAYGWAVLFPAGGPYTDWLEAGFFDTPVPLPDAFAVLDFIASHVGTVSGTVVTQ